MTTIRRVLQLIFSLLVVLLILMMFTTEQSDYLSSTITLGMFIFIIILLGPWWKYIPKVMNANHNISNNKGARRIAYMISVLGVLYSFYNSWLVHMDNQYVLRRWEVSVTYFLGRDGVAVAWILIGIIIIAGIIQMALRYKDIKLNHRLQ